MLVNRSGAFFRLCGAWGLIAATVSAQGAVRPPAADEPPARSQCLR